MPEEAKLARPWKRCRKTIHRADALNRLFNPYRISNLNVRYTGHGRRNSNRGPGCSWRPERSYRQPRWRRL